MSAEGGNDKVRIFVDHGSCSGTAHCQQSMPNVFVVANRKAQIRDDVDWDSIDVAQLMAVADSCPWYAITISS
jgi:ferredoxin